MNRMARRQADTTVRLPADFAATIKALLRTPPPPAGDPSTRKQKPAYKEKEREAMRRGVILGVLMAFSVGCSSSSQTSTPSAPSAPSTAINVAGNWTGFWCQNGNVTTCNLSLSISQNGTTLSGTVRAMTNNTVSWTATLFGLIASSGQVQLRSDGVPFGSVVPNSECAPMLIVATVTGNGNGMTGILTYGCSAAPPISSWSATRS
jgi:hypothetical protein